ncbi:hypothetical protein JCM8097_002637 [Rhodosporidiobolus ruineniae]
MGKRTFDDAADPASTSAAAQDSFGGWQPAPGESPAEREKRLKKEKRAAQLAAKGVDPNTYSAPSSSSYAAPAPAPAQRSGTEDYGGWKPAEGESPAEREKRLKREKRQAKLAELNGPASAPSYGASYGAGAPGGSEKRANEEYGGWRPMDDGESPAEREKRIKREKRAAMLAAREGGDLSGPSTSGYPAPIDSYSAYDRPPHYQSSSPAAAPPPPLQQSEEALAAAAEAEKKSKHAQSKTPARMKYLERKKKVRKANKRAKGKAAVGGEREESVAASISVQAGQKRAREDDGDSEDESDGEEKAGGDKPAAAGEKWADLSPEEREAKAARIAAIKAERREKRLAKKAELKRIKAEGGELPPKKPRVVETTKRRVPATTVVQPPEEEEEKKDGPTEEELEEMKKREEIAARKALKALKKQQRRQAPEEAAALVEAAAAIADGVDEDGDEPMLIPTAVPSAPSASVDAPPPSANVDSPSSSAAAAVEEPSDPAPPSPPAALLRLPASQRPAPPSTAVLSALKVHEKVRDKVVVDPTLKVAIAEKVGEDGTGVGERGRRRLRGEMGVEEWFAVQTATLPLLLPPFPSPALYTPFLPPRDLLVSAPTGSGKTLSYVVPVVETLQRRVVTRLRALVLLPTRDLVGQVRETFEQYAKGTGLKIGVATGQHSFAHEQSVLVGDPIPSDLQGGQSQVDILIATPGRLIDHLKSTKGFSLQHLRFLVVDEADRLLTQSFHDWLPTVLAALKPSSSSSAPVAAAEKAEEEKTEEGLKKADAMAPLWWDAEGAVGMVEAEGQGRCFGSCQKLLFSATLSRDPAKIDALHLHRPIYISVEDGLQPHLEDDAADLDAEKRFTFPAELAEHMLISPASHKPLYLFHLVQTRLVEKGESALCFTKSVEAATRLAKLVELFEEARAARGEGEGKVVVRAFSSELAPGERKKVLKEFKEGKITMLIASDLIARGIDLPHVQHVVSYDIPADMRKYVHRVGRTARAGRKGDAWSLVEEQEVAPFKAIMTSAQHYGQLERVKVKDREVEPFVPAYQVALDKLRAHFATGGAKERV